MVIDQQRCIGCRICMKACPYDRRFFNWGEPPQPTEAQMMAYDPEHQAPALKGTVMKCDFCPDLARAGRRPYCSAACPNHAIYFGDEGERNPVQTIRVRDSHRTSARCSLHVISTH